MDLTLLGLLKLLVIFALPPIAIIVIIIGCFVGNVNKKIKYYNAAIFLILVPILWNLIDNIDAVINCPANAVCTQIAWQQRLFIPLWWFAAEVIVLIVALILRIKNKGAKNTQPSNLV